MEYLKYIVLYYGLCSCFTVKKKRGNIIQAFPENSAEAYRTNQLNHLCCLMIKDIQSVPEQIYDYVCTKFNVFFSVKIVWSLSELIWGHLKKNTKKHLCGYTVSAPTYHHLFHLTCLIHQSKKKQKHIKYFSFKPYCIGQTYLPGSQGLAP